LRTADAFTNLGKIVLSFSHSYKLA
jgi:hypothetical protein